MSTTAGSLEGISAVNDVVEARDRHLCGDARLRLEALATTRTAAAILKISRARVRRLCASGELPAELVDGQWLLYCPAVEAYGRKGQEPVYEAVVCSTSAGRRTVLLEVAGEDETFVRGRWVTISGETRGFEAIEKATVSERVPMAMSPKYGVLARADRSGASGRR
jgi:hypothetical protein